MAGLEKLYSVVGKKLSRQRAALLPRSGRRGQRIFPPRLPATRSAAWALAVQGARRPTTQAQDPALAGGDARLTDTGLWLVVTAAARSGGRGLCLEQMARPVARHAYHTARKTHDNHRHAGQSLCGHHQLNTRTVPVQAPLETSGVCGTRTQTKLKPHPPLRGVMAVKNPDTDARSIWINDGTGRDTPHPAP